MKRSKYILLIILSPLFIFGQQIEIEGGLITDSIYVSSGLIKNVSAPISANDVANKAYVDSIVQSLQDSLLFQLLVPIGRKGVQILLNSGYSVAEILSQGAETSDFIGVTHIEAGGIIFYMESDGTGLVAASTDQGNNKAWGCHGIWTGYASQSQIGVGNINTQAIVNANCNTLNDTAADLCAELSLNGHDDWFLPSKDELYEMYSKIGQGESCPNNIGGFTNGVYWSSTEYGTHVSWELNFSTGALYYDVKFHGDNVRAIRAF